MQFTNLHPMPIIAILTIAAFGVFGNDAHADNAIMIALSTPSAIAEYVSGPDKIALHDQRAHFESGLGGSTELKAQIAVAQPNNRDDKKYIAKRRLMGTAFGNEYSWPLP